MIKNEREGEIEFGDIVEDSVTGFKGTAIGYTQWLTGCDRWVVQPTGTTADGKLFEANSFDSSTVRLLEKGYQYGEYRQVVTERTPEARRAPSAGGPSVRVREPTRSVKRR